MNNDICRDLRQMTWFITVEYEVPGVTETVR
jgi:hypothetical protein